MISGRRLRLWKKPVDTMSTSPEREPVDMMPTSHRRAVMDFVRNIARYMRLDRLIPEFKDAVDKGTLAMVAAVDLSYLNVKMQKLIQQVAEAEGKKLKPKQAVELRKMGKEITKEAVESVLAGKEQKKSQSVSVKLPVGLYEKYFAQMDARAVQEIMEKALEGYFGKEAAGV